MQLGDFKQEVMKVNNQVNQDLFGVGLRWQKVEILEDKVFIFANNKRVKAIAAIDGKDSMTARLIDLALLVEYKGRLREGLVRAFGANILSVMKDYDPGLELAVSVVIFDKPVEQVLDTI
ncbi:MAG: DUF2294 domain-containing protein [Deferrisomatales bacterium]